MEGRVLWGPRDHERLRRYHLTRSLRPPGDSARLGGDEFIILLEDAANVDDATLVAERITRVLETPPAVEGHELSITVSIGIAMSTSGKDRPNDLPRNADATMYRAKNKASRPGT